MRHMLDSISYSWCGANGEMFGLIMYLSVTDEVKRTLISQILFLGITIQWCECLLERMTECFPLLFFYSLFDFIIRFYY